MHVRRAVPSDARAIEDLYRQLVVGDPNIRVDPGRIADLEHDSDNHLLVVDSDGLVCGTALLTLCLDAMYERRPYAVLENVVVSSAARGRGAGRALLTEVERVTRAAHCTKLMLLSSAVRTEAHAFFLHLGFDGTRKRGFVKYLRPG